VEVLQELLEAYGGGEADSIVVELVKVHGVNCLEDLAFEYSFGCSELVELVLRGITPAVGLHDLCSRCGCGVTAGGRARAGWGDECNSGDVEVLYRDHHSHGNASMCAAAAPQFLEGVDMMASCC
jgi:hypothetical protein